MSPDAAPALQPPARLRDLLSWQVSTLGSRLTARHMPSAPAPTSPSRPPWRSTACSARPASAAVSGWTATTSTASSAACRNTTWSTTGPDPADRRRDVVSLTEGGRQHLDQLQQQDELLAGLADAQRRQSQALLTALLDSHAPQPT